jgi:alcohol dehydrogenase
MHKIFSFTGARKIVFGNGSFQQLPDHIRELQTKRPLIVLDKQLAATGMKEQVVELLKKSGMECQIFDKVDPEPKISLADEGAKLALKAKCDIIIGIGGGSAMDVAKAIAVLAANKGKAVDYLGLNKVPGPGLPKIMIPTTAGTGSEVTFTSVFVRPDLKKKEA